MSPIGQTRVLPVTVLLAARNEEPNLRKCLDSLRQAERIVVLDSGSTDGTETVAKAAGAEVVQFHYDGGYPRKRQWALDHVLIATPWVMLVDADEEVPDALWAEIADAVMGSSPCSGYLALKSFHFMGRRFRFGGFSHAGMLLFRFGRARFERLVNRADDGLDMEVHERVITDGPVGRFRTPLMHRDFKGLEAYRERHRRYAVWEAGLRYAVLESGRYGSDAIRPRLLGNAQERRRFLKRIAMRVPVEPLWWFLYHYLIRLGILEGYAGWVACRVRYEYIRDVRAGVRTLKRDGVGSR
jgi:glycosyltransferase involved in cell wall biosynthesis